jgi:flagellar protein FliO/FliZ
VTAASPLLAVLALGAVIGLILLARHLPGLAPYVTRMAVRGGGGPVPPNGLVLEQVLALDARRRLLLVRCGPRRLLLLTGGPQDVAVGWTDAPGEPP